MSSIVAVTAYDYSSGTGKGDASIARYAGGGSGTVIETKTGVVTQYADSGSTVLLPGDTKVFHFRNSAGVDQALIAATQWGSGGTPVCKYLIFNAAVPSTIPSGYNWGTPVYGPATWTIGSTALANLYKIQTTTLNGTFYIYGIDYDAAMAFRLSAGGSTYSLDTTNYYTFDRPSAASEGHGVDLQIVGSNVFTLWISGTNLSSASSASYLDSTLVKTNMIFGSATYAGPHGSTTASGTKPAKNAFSIQPYGSDLLLTGIGGSQQAGTWNPASRIQKIVQSTLVVTDLLRAATTAEASTYPDDCYDFRALAFNESGTQAFILTGIYDSSYSAMNWNLYTTDMTTLLAGGGDLTSNVIGSSIDNASSAGYLWALLYSESTQKTWFARGNDLAIYNTTNIVGSAAGIGSLTSLGTSANLNSITLYSGETAPTTLKGYVAPAFASNTAAALLERKRLLEQIATVKE